MDVKPNEAKEMLEGIDEVTTRAKKMIAYGGGDLIFIVWGVVWFIGGIGSYIAPFLLARHPQGHGLMGIVCGTLWTVLVAIGIIVSYRLGRNSMPTRSEWGRNIGIMWFLLYLFVNLWLALLFPFIKIEGQQQSHLFWTHLGAIAATVPMFAYVLMGLFLDRYMVWIGLGMTALMVLGVYLLEPWFYLWMAIVGGGGLAGTGLMIRNRWKQP